MNLPSPIEGDQRRHRHAVYNRAPDCALLETLTEMFVALMNPGRDRLRAALDGPLEVALGDDGLVAGHPWHRVPSRG